MADDNDMDHIKAPFQKLASESGIDVEQSADVPDHIAQDSTDDVSAAVAIIAAAEITESSDDTSAKPEPPPESEKEQDAPAPAVAPAVTRDSSTPPPPDNVAPDSPPPNQLPTQPEETQDQMDIIDIQTSSQDHDSAPVDADTSTDAVEAAPAVEEDLLEKPLTEEAKAAVTEESEEEEKEEEEQVGATAAAEEEVDDDAQGVGEEDLQQIKKYLPYYSEFLNRPEKSITSVRDFKDDPEGYLQACLEKYSVAHPKEMKDTKSGLRPWIEGTMEKLMPEMGLLNQPKWKLRLFRLFDEALVWFEDASMISKWMKRKETTMEPLGVLPLAMVTSIKTHDFSKIESATEDEVLKLELQIGTEGSFILKCADFHQRIKWLECLHVAVFSVPRPLFTQKTGIWNVNQEKLQNNGGKARLSKRTKQLSTADLDLSQPTHIRMGKSLVLSFKDLSNKLGVTSEMKESEDATDTNDTRPTAKMLGTKDDNTDVELGPIDAGNSSKEPSPRPQNYDKPRASLVL